MANEYSRFEYQPTGTGVISGRSTLKQTEDAINNMGESVYQAETDSAAALALARRAIADSEQAINDASEARGAAEAAQTTANTANATANAASNAATAAETKADNAVSTANSANATATAANATANAASATATNADTNATTALNTANAASATATTAANNSAAAQAAAEAAQNSAANSASDASDAADSAAAAEAAATTSQQSAAASATAAAGSESSAADSATHAQAWAMSANSPDGQADADSPTGETQSSKTWALASKASAQSAATSETNAAQSASDAAATLAGSVRFNTAQTLTVPQILQALSNLGGNFLELFDLGTPNDLPWDEIDVGNFRNCPVGGYVTANSRRYYLGHHNYWLHTGDTECTTNHILIVPSGNLANGALNSTNTTAGGYVGCDFKTGANGNTGYATLQSIIQTDWGSSHILSHREHFTNAVSNGYPSGGTWYDSTIDLMSEPMVYGCKIFEPIGNGSFVPNNYTPDKQQIKLFAERPDLITIRADWWLRGVVSSAAFALVSYNGAATYYAASNSSGLRPAFGIKAS